nr:transposase [Tateyamaria pelophila]
MLIKLHSQATTTPKIRAKIQASDEPAWVLAERFGTTEQTVWKWRKRDSVHPRFKLHFTPTSASWLNLVERFFAEITSRRIRRGSYSSVDDLEATIFEYLAHHNEKPKPFKWTKTAEDILTRERRALNALDKIRGNR